MEGKMNNQPRQEMPVDWREAEKKKPGENLLKNLGVAAALTLCAVTLRNGAVPQLSNATDVVLASVTGDTQLDDQLGKLSFVSTLFPEATLVFGETKHDFLSNPVEAGKFIHAWSEEEPYVSWQTQQREVYASGSGVVMGVYHGENEERLIHVMGENEVSCIYGNIKQATVSAGSVVNAGDLLGKLIEGAECTLEVYVDGVCVNPAEYLAIVQ